jgi:Tol biopolymer transport system component
MAIGILRRPSVLLALALCSVGGVVTLLGRLATGPPVEQKREALSTESGTKAYPAFAPDGQRLAYSSRGSGKNEAYHVFVRTTGKDTPRQLTQGEANDISPVWSPDGEKIAFLRMDDEKAQYLVISASGGAERKIAEFPAFGDESQPQPALAWTPDGKSLIVMTAAEDEPSALAIAAIDGGTATPITHPPAKTAGDSTPVVSPDGSTLAFLRAGGSNGGDIFLADVSGANPRRLTFEDSGIRGLAWTRDSHDIVYASSRGEGWRLWRIPAFGGSPREVNIAGRHAQYPAIAPSGNLLIFVDSPSVTAIWRATLGNPDKEADERPILRSMGRESSPIYSPDGSKIADISDQTGANEIWISDADGDHRTRVTNMNGPAMMRVRWSPDSKSLVFDARGERGPDLFRAPATPGAKPTRLATQAWNGSFSRDGKTIYYDYRGQIWKADANGGKAEALVQRMGAAQAVESADGKYVYFRSWNSISRVPAGGGEEEEDAITPEHGLQRSTTLQMTKNGAYYAEFQRGARAWAVSFYDFGTKKSSVVFRTKNIDFGPGHVFSISPDGKYVLYPKVDQTQTDLISITNFR